MSKYVNAWNTGRHYAANAQSAYQSYKKGDVVGAVSQLIAQPKTSVVSSVTKTLAKTPLKKYLDKNYTRKCGVEVNEIEQTNSGTLSTSLTLLPLTNLNMGIVQGSGQGERAGNSIETKSLGLRMMFETLQTAQDTRIRMFFVRIKRPLLSFVATDLMNNTADIRSFPQLNKARDFTIIKEWNFTLGPASSKGSRHEINYWHNPKGCEQTIWTQSDTLGLYSDCTEGAYAIYAMYETSGLSVPDFSWIARFSYVDI